MYVYICCNHYGIIYIFAKVYIFQCNIYPFLPEQVCGEIHFVLCWIPFHVLLYVSLCLVCCVIFLAFFIYTEDCVLLLFHHRTNVGGIGQMRAPARTMAASLFATFQKAQTMTTSLGSFWLSRTIRTIRMRGKYSTTILQ